MPGLFETLMSKFRSQPAQPTPMQQDIQQAVAIAKKERPDLAPVQEYGFWSKMLQPNAQGYASPGGTIYMNPAKLGGLGTQDIADTLIHEQTHVDQAKRRGNGMFGELMRQMMGNDGNEQYGRRPDEMEAYQNEKNRRYRMGRQQTPIASFQNPTESYIPQEDIYLRK